MKRTELCPFCGEPLIWEGQRAFVYACDSGGDADGVKQSLICMMRKRIAPKP